MGKDVEWPQRDEGDGSQGRGGGVDLPKVPGAFTEVSFPGAAGAKARLEIEKQMND